MNLSRPAFGEQAVSADDFGGNTHLMRADTTALRIERAGRRHVAEREGHPRGHEPGGSVEHGGETRALYLLERDFYGFSLEGDLRARSSGSIRPTSAR